MRYLTPVSAIVVSDIAKLGGAGIRWHLLGSHWVPLIFSALGTFLQRFVHWQTHLNPQQPQQNWSCTALGMLLWHLEPRQRLLVFFNSLHGITNALLEQKGFTSAKQQGSSSTVTFAFWPIPCSANKLVLCQKSCGCRQSRDLETRLLLWPCTHCDLHNFCRDSCQNFGQQHHV